MKHLRNVSWLWLLLCLATLSCQHPPTKSMDLIEPEGPPPPITFSASCETGDHFYLMAVGNINMLSKTQQEASLLRDMSRPTAIERVSSGFFAFFSRMADFLKNADFVMGNLNSPLAENLTSDFYIDGDREICNYTELPPDQLYDGLVYGSELENTGYPEVNTHPALAYALRQAGFAAVQTANLNASDRGSNGIDLTIDAFREAGLSPVGTAKYGQAPEGVVVEVKGVRVGFVGATLNLGGEVRYGGGKVDLAGQVSKIYAKDSNEMYPVTTQIERLRIKNLADFVVAMINMGSANSKSPAGDVVNVAYALAEYGADLVLITRPGQVQKMEKYLAFDGREVLICYSLGNFTNLVDTTIPEQQLSSALAIIELTKTDSGIKISGVGYVPLTIGDASGFSGPLPTDWADPNYAKRSQSVVDIFGPLNRVYPDAPWPPKLPSACK